MAHGNIFRKVLAVDDEPAVRAFLREALTASGFDVVVAASAPEALSLAEQYGPVDVVISDIVMPDVSGIQLAGILQARSLAGKFLFISGYFDSEAAREQLGAIHSAAFLQKPFAASDLLRALRGLMLPDVAREAQPKAQLRQRRGRG